MRSVSFALRHPPTAAEIVDQNDARGEFAQLHLQFGLAGGQEGIFRHDHLRVAVDSVAIAHDRKFQRTLRRHRGLCDCAKSCDRIRSAARLSSTD